MICENGRLIYFKNKHLPKKLLFLLLLFAAEVCFFFLFVSLECNLILLFLSFLLYLSSFFFFCNWINYEEIFGFYSGATYDFSIICSISRTFK